MNSDDGTFIVGNRAGGNSHLFECVCVCESAQTKEKCNFSHMLFFVQNGLEGEISTFGDLRIVVK